MKYRIMLMINKFLSILILVSFFSCEEDNPFEAESCDCEYVTYDKDETTGGVWQESYRSSWDASCDNELLDESVYTDSDGDKWYSKTNIECK